MTDAVDVLEPGRLRGAMGPLRTRILAAVQDVPGSATELAQRVGVSRQRVNYHVRELERAGLLALAETRQRRGFEERVFRATAKAVVTDPSVHGDVAAAAADAQDALAAETLVALSARTTAEVSDMRGQAAAAGKRLLTFAIDADVAFRSPKDIQAFADDLAEAVRALSEKYGGPGARRRYRVVGGGYPMPRTRRSRAQDGAGTHGRPSRSPKENA